MNTGKFVQQLAAQTCRKSKRSAPRRITAPLLSASLDSCARRSRSRLLLRCMRMAARASSRS